LSAAERNRGDDHGGSRQQPGNPTFHGTLPKGRIKARRQRDEADPSTLVDDIKIMPCSETELCEASHIRFVKAPYSYAHRLANDWISYAVRARKG
jgi:hypothetical protein